MAELIFACPSCAKHISCDDAYSGQQIQCPLCGNALIVPARAPAQSQSGSQGSSLVPKPPAGGSRLATQLNAQQAAKTGQRDVPIRQFKADKGPKKNWILETAKILVVLAALAVGGYYGYNYFSKRGEQSAETTPTPGDQAGATSEQAAAPPGTDPNVAPDGSTPAPPAEKELPVIPPVYTTQLSLAKIPESKVNGRITGDGFLPEIIRVERTATSQVLRFVQGNPVSPDREILIYLRLKPGEDLGGQTFSITTDMRGSSVPQVAKRWKTDPRYAPKLKSYSTGYAMLLELGQAADGVVPGKLFVALPDPEESVVAGVFKAQTGPVDGQPTDPNMATPTAAPMQGVPAAESEMFRKRYGLQ